MLKKKVYSAKELYALIGTASKEATDRKLGRYEIEYTTCGRGDTLTYTITNIHDPFKVFCVFDLGFAPQTDFDKLCDFIFFLLNDDDFTWRPFEMMEEYLRIAGRGISRQTLANYTRHLERNDIVSTTAGDFVYYRVYKHYGVQQHEIVEKAAYSAAWKVYWDARERGYDSRAAYDVMYNVFQGTPRKQRIIVQNAFTQDIVSYLSELVAERLNDKYASDKGDSVKQLTE